MTRLPLLIASGAMLLVGGAAFAESGTSASPINDPAKTQGTPETNPVAPTEDSSIPLNKPLDTNSSAQGSAQQMSAPKGTGVNQLVGIDLYNAKDEKVGEIKDVLIGQNNRVETAIVTIGGVMGVAGRDVAIAWNKILLVRDVDRITAKLATMTDDQLEALPEYRSDDGVWHAK
jgi:sporulation protein YlmC with PRC-barrel domain